MKKLSPSVKIKQHLVRWFQRKFTDHYCFYCGVKLVHRSNIKVGETHPRDLQTNDHIYPSSKGGKDNKYNIIKACFNCNQQKGSRPLYVFRKELTGFRDGLFWGEKQYKNSYHPAIKL